MEKMAHEEATYGIASKAVYLQSEAYKFYLN